MSRKHISRAAIGVGALALALLAWALAASPTPNESEARAQGPLPNIVLVVTDDQRYDTLWAMPTVRHELAAKGTRFTNGFVVNPVCCPSRASILTGEYSHSTGVWSNGGDYGGFDAFHGDENTIATWLDGAGYHTGLVGKYLNHYADPEYIPPGWDRWAGLLSESEGKYYNYMLNLDGDPTHFGGDPSDYSTDVMMNWGEDFIRSAPADEPLFLYVATKAPHGAAIPAPRHENLYKGTGAEASHGPAIHEQSLSDKPDYISSRPPPSQEKIDSFLEGSLQADRALAAVDEGIGQLLAALRETGRLNDTMFVFISDNGNLWGEHSWGAKNVPYEESIRVPIVVRYDPLVAKPGMPSAAMALNIDLAPTFAEIAGVEAPGVEGRSLVPFLEKPSLPGRADFIVEHLQLVRPDPEARQDKVPSYCALRARHSMFVQYATGERELYNLENDPWEMKNIASEPSSIQEVLDAKGRLAQMCDPLPPGFPPGIL